MTADNEAIATDTEEMTTNTQEMSTNTEEMGANTEEMSTNRAAMSVARVAKATDFQALRRFNEDLCLELTSLSPESPAKGVGVRHPERSEGSRGAPPAP